LRKISVYPTKRKFYLNFGRNKLFLCLKCFRVYNQKTIKHKVCKNKNCNGEVVEIDELFIPVIAELNRKGYKTKYCCSGHIEDTFNSYIYFEDDIELPNLPDGYLFDKDAFPQVNWTMWETKNTIRRLFDENKNNFDLSKEILESTLKVMKWVEELPDLMNK
jgi:hypothetical protein